MGNRIHRAGMLALIGLAGLVLHASSSHALAIASPFGVGAFDPNNTAPHLELQVVGSTTETTGGVSLALNTSFELDIAFKDGGGVDTYTNLILTAATNDTSISVQLSCPAAVCGGPAEMVTLDSFGSFGLVFPPGGIRGIGNGAGDYLSLNGASVGGFDLMTGLQRGVTESIRVGIDVTGFNFDEGDRLRFDIFGVDGSGNVIGNNPNSGAAGVAPEPGAALVFAVGLLTVSRFIRRRR